MLALRGLEKSAGTPSRIPAPLGPSFLGKGSSESGPAMLDKISDFYDHEVEVATESLTAAIEPLMVVVMGALVGVMVICLYLPMFTIYQNVAKGQ